MASLNYCQVKQITLKDIRSDSFYCVLNLFDSTRRHGKEFGEGTWGRREWPLDLLGSRGGGKPRGTAYSHVVVFTFGKSFWSATVMQWSQPAAGLVVQHAGISRSLLCCLEHEGSSISVRRYRAILFTSEKKKCLLLILSGINCCPIPEIFQ
jgi:hypothetical protein